MKKIIALLFALLITVGVFTGCGNQNGSESKEAAPKKLNIVTTIFPEYDWVKEILGEKAENANITMLLDNGVDLHSYQPTADDSVKIANCDLFIYVGGESDSWVSEKAPKNTVNKNRKVINLLNTLNTTVKTEEAMPGMQAEEGHHHGYSHFADSDVQDRTLSDWSGSWQSVYPYLKNGTLDKVMERKAESGDKTAEEYHTYYETGYKSDVEKIKIDGKKGTIEFN